MRILIAENDSALGLFLKHGLEADGHLVQIAHDGVSSLDAFRDHSPDLTILELNLPIRDGEQVLIEIRRAEEDLPVLVLTGRRDLETRVRCLDLGADDFMLKPFSLFELRARCRALLRRRRETRLLLRAGDLELNRLDRAVRRGGESMLLSNTEFALLEHLMLHRGHAVAREQLLNTVWHMESSQTTNIVDVYVNYLRRKLSDPAPGALIRTVRGKGYMVPVESDIRQRASTPFRCLPGSPIGAVALPKA